MRNKKAFTLIEVMVVMAIIAVLAILIIGAITLARRTATETTHRSNAKTIQTALERVYATNKMYCGGSTGITCGANTWAALNTALSTPTFTDTGCDVVAGGGTACGTGAIQNGACLQAVAQTTYTITAYDWNCTNVVDTYQVQ